MSTPIENPRYVEPLMKYVSKTMFPVLKKLIMEQNGAFLDSDAEKANTVMWMQRAFDVMRGIEFEIAFKNANDDEGDPMYGLAGCRFTVGVAEQADVKFQLNVGDEVDLMELRTAIREMFSIFEVSVDGKVIPFLEYIKYSTHLDRFMVMSGTIAYGKPLPGDDSDAEYYEEISEYEIKDLDGNPSSIRLII